ncbi:MAG TPA: hypothetical protein VGM98_15740 [Schlesneria sp.]
MTTKPKSPMPVGCVGTLVALSQAVGVSEKTLQTWRKSVNFPARPDGCYSIWEIAAWYFEHGPGARVTTDDSDLSGPASPALERYREERALISRMERLKLEGELLPREVVRESFSLIAGRLRRLGERFQAGCTDPAALLNDTLADIEAAGQQFLEAEQC